jgi:hypothetical protein
MKTIQTESYLKLAARYDDQPNFVNRDNPSQGTALFPGSGSVPESKKDIAKRWKRRKKAIVPNNPTEKMPQRSI